MFVCVYSVFVLSCVGSGLATGWLLVYKCKIMEPHKEEAKARNGLERHIRRRRNFVPTLIMQGTLPHTPTHLHAVVLNEERELLYPTLLVLTSGLLSQLRITPAICGNLSYTGVLLSFCYVS
jgi:hypothetical protein